jgi:3-oxoacyl-[acyl-carrier protein] reductase
VVATGRAGSLVTAKPVETISCSEVRERFVDLGLTDRVALVVGGSRGIGAATAKHLAMLGARVAVHYFRGERDALQIVDDIVAQGGRAMAVAADVRDDAHVASMLAQISERWGDVDILVNCAVNDFLPKSLLDTDWQDYVAELDVSLKGMHQVCRRVIPAMQQKHAGKIILLSTVATEKPAMGQSKYATIKSALTGYVRSLAMELAADAIQVNLVVPNVTQTSLLASLGENLVQRIGQERPDGRVLEPVEVAQSIAFLASRWSNGISGQRLILNQGESIFL